MGKTLVAYFSKEENNYANGGIKDLPVGNTEVIANMIKELTGADVFKIEPLKENSQDYNECTAKIKKEQQQYAGPEPKNYLDNIDDYDVIYLGFPNYWGTMPMPMFMFLKKYNFTGKVIKPFCTHEGSGVGTSERGLKWICPKAKIEKGFPIISSDVNKVKELLEF